MAHHIDREQIEGHTHSAHYQGCVGTYVVIELEPGETAWAPLHPGQHYTGTGTITYGFFRAEPQTPITYLASGKLPWKSCTTEHPDTITLASD